MTKLAATFLSARRGRTAKAPLDVLRSTILFDPVWYRESHPDLRGTGIDAVKHYLEHGAREGRNPHPLFDTKWYLSHTPDITAYDVNPLVHYLIRKNFAGSHPHPLFDVDLYAANAPGFESSLLDPLTHYLTIGWKQGIQPSKFFDPQWYLEQYPDVRATGVEPLTHYVQWGWRQDRQTCSSIDPITYRERYALSTKEVVAEMGPATRLPIGSAESPMAPLVLPDLPPMPNWQRLRDYLVDEAFGFGEDSAKRVLQYFSMLAALRGPGVGALPRSEIIAALTTRLRRLSRAAASDSRPVKATIIITAFGHVEYTLACAISLLEHKCDARYEVIVGNDISADETREVFEAAGGIIRCITHQKREGFLKNCNLSAERANGEYLVLLNNDTLILDYWLDELLAPFDRYKDVGLVGSKLLNADGTLQEAGGIIWSDGSGWNFGRGQDPRGYQFNYVKDVDYVSGAAIAVPKALWKEVGGFDERYMPAYAEDTDLAFQVRAKGLRTLYAPRSEVIHHEGISHGTDVSAGVKSYQVVNQDKFVKKWQETLLRDHFHNGDQVFLARDRSRHRKHILVFDHYVPKVDRDGGSRMMYDFLKLFVDAGLQVSFWPDNGHYDREYARELQNFAVEIVYGRNVTGNFREWIKQTGPHLDYAFLHRPHVSEHYIDALCEHSPAKRLFYGADLHSRRLEREYAQTGRAEFLEESKHTREIESYVWQRSDVVYYPAPEEVAFVQQQVPGKKVCCFPVQVYPNEGLLVARDRAGHTRPDPPTILYVAGFAHRPNVDAILWFAREVLPLVKKRVPECITIVAGSFPPRSVTSLARDDILVTQAVSWPVLEWFYRSAHVAIAPVRFGGGVKGKILEAMRYGVAVVTTKAGAEGIDRAEEIMAVADTPEAFADSVVTALRDPRSVKRRVLNGLDYLERQFSYTAVAARLASEIPELERIVQGRGVLQR
jgi:GT2 family glycosyltransferase